MAGVGHSCRAGLGVEGGVGGGDKGVLEAAAECLVDFGEKPSRLGDVVGAGLERDLDHRGNERRRYPVAADIGDDHAEPSGRGVDEVVEVTGDGRCRMETHGDLEAGDRWWSVREDGHLDLARRFELALDAGELVLGGEGTGTRQKTSRSSETGTSCSCAEMPLILGDHAEFVHSVQLYIHQAHTQETQRW